MRQDHQVRSQRLKSTGAASIFSMRIERSVFNATRAIQDSAATSAADLFSHERRGLRRTDASRKGARSRKAHSLIDPWEKTVLANESIPH